MSSLIFRVYQPEEEAFSYGRQGEGVRSSTIDGFYPRRRRPLHPPSTAYASNNIDVFRLHHRRPLPPPVRVAGVPPRARGACVPHHREGQALLTSANRRRPSTIDVFRVHQHEWATSASASPRGSRSFTSGSRRGGRSSNSASGEAFLHRREWETSLHQRERQASLHRGEEEVCSHQREGGVPPPA